ncbi:MAG: ACT domain-containing protein, partial [Candidatus Omnitrophica bacterium]|nr:ACT domain-containing protein [Candidatus Omnitrophota bacterium]
GEELGYCLKLLAIAKLKNGGLELRVHPALLPTSHPLSSIQGAYNGIYLTGDLIGETLFYGKGAGANPTASSVIADIVSIAEGKGEALNWMKAVKNRKINDIGELRTKYYFRFMALDKPGVLARIAASLGKHGISILSCIQKEREKKVVPVVMLTHWAKGSSVQAVLKEIDRLSVIKEKTVVIRVEESE